MENLEIRQDIFRLLSGKATPEEEKRIRRWLEEEGNKQIYEETCRTYYQLQYAAKWENVGDEKVLQNVQMQIDRKSNLRKWGYWISGIAALILLFVGGGIFLTHTEKTVPVAEILHDVHFGEKKAMLTLPNGQKVELVTGNEVSVDLGFAQAVEDSVTGLRYQLKDSTVVSHELHTLSVPRAGEYIMVLSDGSRVWLNSETELKYPVFFDADKREIYVTGEAFFEVVKDPSRPFIVHTPHTQTTVLGTSFNVMAYQDVQQTEITLVTGKVKVDAGKESCQIVPGQQVAVDNRSLHIESKEVNVSFYTSWKEGLFDFDNMKLGDLCVQLSRWYDVDFFFVNSAAAERRFTGAIKRNNTLRFMLEFVEKTSSVRFEVNGKTVSVYNQ